MEAKRRRVHKQKIILSNTPDADSVQSARRVRHGNQKTHSNFSLAKRSGMFVAEFIPAVILLIIPFSVHAGLVDKVIDIFSDDQQPQVALEQLDNSADTMRLLSATKNPDLSSATGGGEIQYQDGVLVSSGPIGKDVVNASKTNTGEISVYVVRDGDSLSQIAEMYGVTSNTILWANDLKSAKDIHPGDTLVILPIVGIQHTVAKGETLASIVKNFGADLDEVTKYNNIDATGSVTVGDVLIIPGGEIKAPTPTPRTSKKVSSASPTKLVSTSARGSGSGSWLINPAPGSVETQGIHGYNAVDLASYGGKHIPVLAAATGQVIVSKSSGWNGGYGQYIVIKHPNGEQTLYAHLSKNLAGVGDSVTQGEQIGVMGETGEATGVHVHFEVRGGVNPF